MTCPHQPDVDPTVLQVVLTSDSSCVYEQPETAPKSAQIASCKEGKWRWDDLEVCHSHLVVKVLSLNPEEYTYYTHLDSGTQVQREPLIIFDAITTYIPLENSYKLDDIEFRTREVFAIEEPSFLSTPTKQDPATLIDALPAYARLSEEDVGLLRKARLGGSLDDCRQAISMAARRLGHDQSSRGTWFIAPAVTRAIPLDDPVIVDTSFREGVPVGSIYSRRIGCELSTVGFQGQGQFGRWAPSKAESMRTGIDWVAVAPILRDVAGTPDQYDVGAAIYVRKSQPTGHEDGDTSAVDPIQDAVWNWFDSANVRQELDDYNSQTSGSQAHHRKGILQVFTSDLSDALAEACPDMIKIGPTKREESIIL